MGRYTYDLEFISQIDFENHVKNTIKQYNDVLKSINLKIFNNNLIDPIKLMFDKSVFGMSYQEIIKLEIHRQRDRSNNNIIGFFHQNIFQFIENCIVPRRGWDVVFKSPNKKIFYVEMKNKHNTMNSSSSSRTYMKFQNHLLNASDRDSSICVLVEIIAKESQDIPWVPSLDGIKQSINQNIRRISIDKFYEYVIGDKLAFRKLCEQLPKTVEMLIENNKILKVENDTVFEELKKLDNDIMLSLYKLAFKTYLGFSS